MGEVVLQCRGLSKSFGPIRAVEDISLSLEAGEFLALLGPSGCGKTTTLRILAGFEAPDAGVVEIGGRQMDGPAARVPPEERRVGMVFQEHVLFPHLDVAGNIAYGLPRGPGRRDRVEQVLSLVGLAGLGSRSPHQLSGGQQQRVALARALAPQPEVVLLDEPFSNLDVVLRAQMRQEIREILKATGATTVLVTHNQEEALSLADRVAVMWQGRIIQTATPQELYWHPATSQVAAFVGDANFLPGEGQAGGVACELGLLLVEREALGPVQLMVRPEVVVLVPSASGSATVVERQFYGHDQTVTVRLDSGLPLRARLLGLERAPMSGQRVEVRVRGPAVAFPVS